MADKSGGLLASMFGIVKPHTNPILGHQISPGDRSAIIAKNLSFVQNFEYSPKKKIDIRSYFHSVAIFDAFLRSSDKLSKIEVEAAGAASILMAAKSHGYKINSQQVSKFPLFS